MIIYNIIKLLTIYNMIDIEINKKDLENAKSLEFQFTDYLGIKKITDMSEYLEDFKTWDIEDFKKRIESLMIDYSNRYWVTLLLDDKKVAWVQNSNF